MCVQKHATKLLFCNLCMIGFSHECNPGANLPKFMD